MSGFNPLKFLNQVGEITTRTDLNNILLDPESFKDSNDFNIGQGPLVDKGQFMLHTNFSVWIDKEHPDLLIGVVRWSCPILLSNSGENHIGLLIPEKYGPDVGNLRLEDAEAVSLHLTEECFEVLIEDEVRPLMRSLFYDYGVQLYYNEAIIAHKCHNCSRKIDISSTQYGHLSPVSELVKNQVILLAPFVLELQDPEFSVMVRKCTDSFFLW